MGQGLQVRLCVQVVGGMQGAGRAAIGEGCCVMHSISAALLLVLSDSPRGPRSPRKAVGVLGRPLES